MGAHERQLVRVTAAQRRVNALSEVLDRVVLAVTGALLACVIVVLFLQVLYRYVIKEPLSWSEEGARFALVWLAMLAGARAARHGQHFAFRWALMPLPLRVRWWLRQAINVATLLFLVLILRESISYLDVVAGRTATSTGLNLRWAYGGISVGVALLIVFYALDLIDAACSLATGRELSVREAFEREVHNMLSDAGPSEEALPPTVAAVGVGVKESRLGGDA